MTLPKVHLHAAYPPTHPYVRVAIHYPVAATDDTPAALAPVVGTVQAMGDGEISSFVNSDNFGYAAGAALVYHGYKRTGSLIWAILYGLAGKELPVVAVPVALAQGFARKKPCPL
jgi:hypothetical protein